jgi:CofD-related protein of GAK system
MSNPSITISRAVELPDGLRLSRHGKTPELGPRLLFFSGGTALRDLSRDLIRYTHNSIHIMTPFDSGGSSAKLRTAFNMLAVGDIRNRIMALADRSMQGNPEIFRLFAYRFPKDADNGELWDRLREMERGRDQLVAEVPDPMRKIIRMHLRFFMDPCMDEFDLRGASIGNLILTGGYFNYHRLIDPVIYLFTKLVEARGIVRPVINVDMHLAAELENGEVIIGQHLLTGKEAAPIDSPIRKVWATRTLDDPAPVDIQIREKMHALIRSADLIVYPMGSFFSSVIANLLPGGVGDAVAAAPCPKIFIPNLGNDPELVRTSVLEQMRLLFNTLETSSSRKTARGNLLNFILIDSRGDYGAPLELDKIRRYGVEVLDCELISEDSSPLLDARKVNEILLSLV